jgi:hypothetical protein
MCVFFLFICIVALFAILLVWCYSSFHVGVVLFMLLLFFSHVLLFFSHGVVVYIT